MIIANIVGALAIGLVLWSLIAWLVPSSVAIPRPRWGAAPPEATSIPRELLEELLARMSHIWES